MSSNAIITGLAAELVALQASPIAGLDTGVVAMITKEQSPRLIVWNQATKRVALIPWDKVRALADAEGLSFPNPEIRH